LINFLFEQNGNATLSEEFGLFFQDSLGGQPQKFKNRVVGSSILRPKKVSQPMSIPEKAELILVKLEPVLGLKFDEILEICLLTEWGRPSLSLGSPIKRLSVKGKDIP
jgi:hypothetical protein